MQRYFVPAEQWDEQTIVILGDDAHHITRVMRAKPDDEIIVSNGIDREVLAKVVSLAPQQVTAEVVTELALDKEPALDVWIAQSLPKGDKFEMVIQKVTEIGATRIIPFTSARTIVQYDAKKQAKRLERWQKICKEAAEQAHRNRIPKIDSVHDWKAILELASEANLALICYEKENDGRGLKDVLMDIKLKSKLSQTSDRLSVMIVVGPEGGFTEQEIEQAEAAGVYAVGLGRRILRTETAALVALTALFYEIGEMGGNESCQQ